MTDNSTRYCGREPLMHDWVTSDDGATAYCPNCGQTCELGDVEVIA